MRAHKLNEVAWHVENGPHIGDDEYLFIWQCDLLGIKSSVHLGKLRMRRCTKFLKLLTQCALRDAKAGDALRVGIDCAGPQGLAYELGARSR